MNILLVDDHAMVRQGLKSTLKEAFPQAFFGEAQNALEAMQHVRSGALRDGALRDGALRDGALRDGALRGEASSDGARGAWNIVILDIGLPGRDGVETLKDIRHENANLPVLMLSMYPEEQFAVRVLKAGAAGYMTKETVAEELVNAVRRVLAGEKYVSASLAQQLASGLNSNSDAPLHDRLSDREYQVMCLLASGKSVSEIAADLVLSVKTVSTYRTHIMQKMNMKTNAEIIRYAIYNSLVN